MTNSIIQRPSGGWWTALGVALAVLVVARTNTVDAPADAMTIGLGAPEPIPGSGGAGAPGVGFTLPSAPGASDAGESTRYLWTLESEIRALESELAVERSRARLLQESYGALEEKFLRLTAVLPLLVPDAERDRRSGEGQPQPTKPSVSTGPKWSGTQLERSPR